MSEMSSGELGLVGRKKELEKLDNALDNALAGKGSTVFVSGEPGIGKSRLVEAFRDSSTEREVRTFAGAASADVSRPFLIFSEALGDVIDKPLFEEQEYNGFTKLFVVNNAGKLVVEASAEEEGLDADIFAGVLSAVQDFVRDSFDQTGTQKAGLGRLEYGNMNVIIEHGSQIFLTAVFTGEEHPEMKHLLARTLAEIETKHAAALESGPVQTEEMASVQQKINELVDMRFLVRKNLEGMNLQTERLRIADEILEVLNRLSAEKPMQMIMEDLHWADESSLFVLNYLARNIRDSPVFILGTLRPKESEPLQKFMDDMKVEQTMEEMVIEHLELENTIEIMNWMFAENNFPDTLAEQLFARSKGNPLFVIEMLKGMHEDGSIAKQDGQYTLLSESYQIPATVEEVVNRRLESLEADVLQLIEYASCIGRQFDCNAAFSIQTLRNPQDALEKAQNSEIIIRNNGTAEFSHAVFQSVIYDSLGARWKRGHHKSLGEYFEETYADNMDEVMYDLARHFSKAHEHRKSADYCTRAGEKAEGSFAMEQALDFYDEALEAFMELDRDFAFDKTITLLERMGDVHTVMGNFDEAMEKYRRVDEMAEDDVTKASVTRKTADVHEKRSEYDLALETLAAAKRYLQEGTVDMGRIMVIESRVLDRKGEFDLALDIANSALEIFEESGEKEDIGNALIAVGNILRDKRDFDGSLTYYKRSLKVMEECDQLYGVAVSLNNIGNYHLDKKEMEEALPFFERSIEIVKKIGDKYAIAISHNNIGVVYDSMGRYEEALECHYISLAIREKLGDTLGKAITLYNIGDVQYHRQEWDESLESFGRSKELLEAIGDEKFAKMAVDMMDKVRKKKHEDD